MAQLIFTGSQDVGSGTALTFTQAIDTANSAGSFGSAISYLTYSNGSSGTGAQYATMRFHQDAAGVNILDVIEIFGYNASSEKVPIAWVTGLGIKTDFSTSTYFSTDEKIEVIQLMQNLFAGNDDLFMSGKVSSVFGDFASLTSSGSYKTGSDNINLTAASLATGYSNFTIYGDTGTVGTNTVVKCGNDTITTFGKAVVYGDTYNNNGKITFGNDRIVAIGTGSVIYGDSTDYNATTGGNDYIYGAGTMYGGGGNDTIVSGGDNDVMNGGAGFDILSYNLSGSYYAVTQIIDLVTPGNNNGAGAGDTYTGFEGLIGRDVASYGDDLRGDDNNNRIWGLMGDDIILGRGGNDTISGGAGADALNGGTGVNTLDYMTSSAGVIVDLLNQTVTGGDATGDTITSFTHVLGSNYSDRLAGNGSNNFLRGYSGNDSISGGNGADTLVGDNGNDRLFGGSGNDSLNGGDGNDTLTGNAGSDKMTGGAGNDVFVFTSKSDSTVATSGQDTIYDFTGADTIDLHLIDASTKKSGNQAFDFIGTQSFHGVAGELRYVKAASDTYIYADTNGDKKADFAIHLDDAYTFHANDFIL